MKKFIVLSLLILVSCSKEIKSESKSCTYNGQPVDCSVLEGQNNPPARAEALTVESPIDFTLTNEGGRDFITINKAVSKTVKGRDGTECSLDIKAEKVEFEVYEKSKIVVKTNNEEQTYYYKFGSSRSQSDPMNGTWLKEDRFTSFKLITALIFAERSLKIKLDCLPR